DPAVGLAATLMQPISDEATRIGNKASEYVQSNIAKIITCEDDDAFAAQREKMISDINAMGYDQVLEEVQANFEDAKAAAETFK
ncbi:MAG: hypothetical protein ACLSGA_14645, partial [Ruminococcus sp.]